MVTLSVNLRHKKSREIHHDLRATDAARRRLAIPTYCILIGMISRQCDTNTISDTAINTTGKDEHMASTTTACIPAAHKAINTVMEIL
jgi:hypothetical protein